MKKRQRKIRLIRAGIQLLFFIFAPALFSTAFAGVKSVFQAIAAHQAISWNSFLASGASCIYPYRLVQQASGHEPMGCVFHAHRWQTSRCCLQGGDCAADSAHDRNVHSGKIFLPVPLPNGRNFCYNAYSALCAVQP